MPPVEELIIVDGCSDDGTVQVVREHRPEARIILQPPAGKGTAMRAGFELATAPYVVAMDADGSMDPRELPAYAALFELGYDVVKGSRSAVGGDSTDLTVLRRFGNRGLVGLHNALFRTRLSDLCYGFIGFRRDKLEVLGLYADGFEIEAQIIAHARLAELSMAEVPSRESERIHGESNLRTFQDGRRVLRAMLRTRFQPGRELWRHRASDLPAHLAAVDDLTTATDEARVVPTQRQVPGPHMQP
jgi:glycosyltransferase involved in cell wall biosynthesis